MRKGFAITLDAATALSLFFLAMVLLATQTFQPAAPRMAYLKQVSLDSLTVMEKSGRIGAAIDGNSSAVREVMQATPELVCIQISISDSGGDAIATIAKANCEVAGKELQVASIGISHGGESYMVSSQSWFRKEGG